MKPDEDYNEGHRSYIYNHLQQPHSVFVARAAANEQVMFTLRIPQKEPEPLMWYLWVFIGFGVLNDALDVYYYKH